jgi:CheY-like chemotaxis protein
MTAERPALGVVLVVDDEAGMRELARRILEEAGYGVIDAADAAAAIALVNGGAAVDFLIADLDMPGMLGHEMAAKIRMLRPGLQVLYVTAHNQILFNDRLELAHGEAFLDKPYTVAGLLEAVSLLKLGHIKAPVEAPAASRWRHLLDAVGKLTGRNNQPID